MPTEMAKQAKQNHPTVLYKRKIQYSQIVLAILATVYTGDEVQKVKSSLKHAPSKHPYT